MFLGCAAGLAGAGVGVAAGLQFEPIDHWLFVCDWASVRIRSETCFGEEGRSETCPTGAAGVGAPVKAAMP